MCLAVISRWENLGHYHSALAGTESSSSEAEIAEPCLCFEIVKVIACLAASKYAAISILKIDLGPGPCPSAIVVAPILTKTCSSPSNSLFGRGSFRAVHL